MPRLFKTIMLRGSLSGSSTMITLANPFFQPKNKAKKRKRLMSTFGSTFTSQVHVLPFFFSFSIFFLACVSEVCGYCSWIVAANVHFSIVNSASVHCLRTHKYHFLAIFSLKMDPLVLFKLLKIILLKCFQFSVFNISKISSIQTDTMSFYDSTHLFHALWALIFLWV